MKNTLVPKLHEFLPLKGAFSMKGIPKIHLKGNNGPGPTTESNMNFWSPHTTDLDTEKVVAYFGFGANGVSLFQENPCPGW